MEKEKWELFYHPTQLRGPTIISFPLYTKGEYKPMAFVLENNFPIYLLGAWTGQLC